MSAIVHGWCGYVEKANDVVWQQMVLNKLWIPDVLIDIIKDFMYISAEEVLRKFYRLHLNLSIKDISCSVIYLQDHYGRDRIAIWRTQTGYYGIPEINLEGSICIECGSYCSYHETGCCPLVWDVAGEAPELYMRMIEDEEEEEQIQGEEVTEVTWDVSIPVASDLAYPLISMNDHEEYDWESQMADYAEYQRELQEEQWNGRHGR